MLHSLLPGSLKAILIAALLVFSTAILRGCDSIVGNNTHIVTHHDYTQINKFHHRPLLRKAAKNHHIESEFTVGSHNTDGVYNALSNWGPQVDIPAPAPQLSTSTYIVTAHLTGAAAWYLARNPYATPSATKAKSLQEGAELKTGDVVSFKDQNGELAGLRPYFGVETLEAGKKEHADKRDKFTVELLDNGKVAFRAFNNKYLGYVWRSGKLQIEANQNSANDAFAQFYVEELENGKTAILSTNGKYLGIQPSGANNELIQSVFDTPLAAAQFDMLVY